VNRGFIEEAMFEPPPFLTHTHVAFSLHPIQAVSVCGLASVLSDARTGTVRYWLPVARYAAVQWIVGLFPEHSVGSILSFDSFEEARDELS
jgi:hypothetical protein